MVSARNAVMPAKVAAPAQSWPRKRTVSKRQAEEEARRRAELAANEKRVSQQRALFDALDGCAAKDRLLHMMRQRVFDLLNECRVDEADAILEFMPEQEADAILSDFFEV